MDRKHNLLRGYAKDLRLNSSPFPCPHCQISILPRNFEKHCSSLHGMNALYCCVWCFGSETWEKGKKFENARHLMRCFRNFMLTYSVKKSKPQVEIEPIVNEPMDEETKSFVAADNDQNNNISLENVQNPRLLDMTPMCDPESFFEHEDIRRQLPLRAFQQFNLLDDESLVTYFRDSNLNCAASYVRKYIETRNETDWYHIMLKANIFESFLQIVDENRGKIFMLPFSCWCDGNSHESSSALYRQHRHMIVVTDKGYFLKNIWHKIKLKEKAPKNSVSKKSKKIESPMHLVNTIGYLSKRESKCQFQKQNNCSRKKKKGSFTNKHFYIFKTLPKDYLLPLAGQWEGGLLDLMYQEMFQNVSILELVNSPLILHDGKYKQRIKDFYKFQGGLVLPLSKEFITNSTGKETPHVFHLLNGQKLHFEESEENMKLDDESWLIKQVQGRNCFYENVWTEMWVPRLRDQKQLNIMRPILEENWKLQSTVENLNENLDSLKRKYDEIASLMKKHEQEIVYLNTKYEMLWEKHQKLIDAAAAAAREKDEKI